MRSDRERALIYMERNYDIINKFVFNLVGDCFAAEDITHNVVICICNLNEKAKIISIESYVYKSLRNKSIDYLRSMTRERSRIRFDADMSNISEKSPTPLQCIEDKRKLLRLIEFIEAMPSLTKEIFILNRFEGIPQNLIAKRLGLSSATVNVILNKSLVYYKSVLEE